VTTEYSVPTATHLFRYVLGSADMYCCEDEQRDVFAGTDEKGIFRIWGETAEAGSTAKIDLCRILLEYGLYCCSWCSTAERLEHMQEFGARIGQSLAQYFGANPWLGVAEDSAVRALEIVFGTTDACFSAQLSDSGVRFRITDCPLENEAKRSGLPSLELAHHGMSAMCRSLILDTNPHASVDTSSDASGEFTLTIGAKALA